MPERPADGNVACPAAGCCDRPTAGCTYCPDHQRLVTEMSRWLYGRPNPYLSTFDSDRVALEPTRQE